MKKNNIYF